MQPGRAGVRSAAPEGGAGRAIVLVAVLVLLLISAAGTAVFREFHDGRVDAGSEWLLVALGGLAGLALGAALIAVARRTGLAARLLPGAGLAGIALVLATTFAVGATAGVATLHVGPPGVPGRGTLPPSTSPPVTLPAREPVQLDPGGGLPGWLVTVLAVLAIVIVVFGLFQVARGFQLPRWRLRGGLRWRAATAGETTEELVDVELAADSFDESAAMIGDGLDPRSAIIAAYARLLERLGEAGCPRLPAEAPEEHLRRSLTSLGVERAAMETVVGRFLVARFSTHPLTEIDRDEVREALREAGRQLRQAAALRAAAEEAASAAADAGRVRR